MTTSKMKDADMPLRDRIEAAIERIRTGQVTMRVPVEATDPDVVLADCLAELDAASAQVQQWRDHIDRSAEIENVADLYRRDPLAMADAIVRLREDVGALRAEKD